MKIRNIVVMMAVALAAVACTSEREVRQKEPVPIQLTASVSRVPLTRGADGNVIETDALVTRGIQDEQLASGEKVYVWAKQEGSSSWTYLKGWTLTADGNGALTGSAQYYPIDGTGITMNAVHGNFGTGTITENSTAITTLTHNVEEDQSTTGKYEVSDLLYGTVEGRDVDATKIIPFEHKLSKIEVTLTPGPGYTTSNLTDAEVKLNNVLPTITINPENGTPGLASGSATTITARRDATGVYEAVIPPQTLTDAQANTFLTVTLDGLESSARNTVKEFDGNTKYVYDVTVGLFDPGIPLSTVTAAHLGKVIAANGKVYDTKATADIFSEGVAMIGHITGTGHGYAFSLWNAGTGTIAQSVPACSSYAKGKPEGTSWDLPSLTQWLYIFESCGGSSHTTNTNCQAVVFNYGNLRTMMVACGGEDFEISTYWSSTLCSGYTDVWHNFNFEDKTWCGSHDQARYIRPCLTF